MDLIVRQIADDTWVMSDLLARRAGSVEQTPEGVFRVIPAGHGVEAMTGLSPGPYASLNAALAAIETQTRGTCRIEEGGGDPDDALPPKPATADVVAIPVRDGDA